MCTVLIKWIFGFLAGGADFTIAEFLESINRGLKHHGIGDTSRDFFKK